MKANYLAKASGNIIGRDTLSQKVYAVLRERILTGQLKQGERIGEIAISKELGVSSTPVREALRLLNGDSLIEYEGRRGARVICPSASEIKQCYDVRLALETVALKEAHINFTDDDRDQFVQLATNTCKPTTSRVQHIKRDREFHTFFIEKAANTWLTNFHRAITDFLLVARLPAMIPDRFASTGQEHVTIASAIRDGDVEKALATLETQIRRSCQWAIDSHATDAQSRPASSAKVKVKVKKAT